MNYGETLRKIRVQKGFSQEYVATKLGKRQTTYSEWERKSVIPEDRLLAILHVLETTPDAFFNVDAPVDAKAPVNDADFVQFLMESHVRQQEIIKELAAALHLQSHKDNSG